jgi:hypothetical protein
LREVYRDLTSNETPQDVTVAYAEDAFRYLINEFSATFKATRRASYTVLGYVLRDVFFEVQMDFRTGASSS